MMGGAVTGGWEGVSPALGAAAGLVLIVATLVDAFEVMLLPRRVRRRLRFVRFFFVTTWRAWSATGRRLGRGKVRQSFLSVYGPLSMVVLLAVWTSALVVGFALVQWALHRGSAEPLAFGTALYMSGVTFFTLGYGDVTPGTPLTKVVAVLEAGAGFGLIAVIIGYLPVLYQLFSRREAHVIRLDARAGSPPAATTLLVRHAEGERMDAMDDLLNEWEQWSAELLESHLSYPMLAYYRSQHDNESWLAALTAVLDSCALVLVGFRGVNTFQARMTFATARLALVEMAAVFGPVGHPDGDGTDRGSRLRPAEFRRMRAALEEVGLVFADRDAAEQDLAAFRATYEPFVEVLGAYLDLPLPRWIAPEGAVDNWQRSRGGAAAKRLVEGAEAEKP